MSDPLPHGAPVVLRHYTRTAVALHWLVALLIAGGFTLGLVVGDLPFSPQKLKLINYHKWVGITVLALLLLRVMQGAAIGGEIPGAWVFVAEHAPKRHIGLAIGTLTSGLTGGILLGSLVATAVNRHYTPEQVKDFAWRVPFLVGGVFGFFAVFLRQWLEETPVFEELRRRKALAQELPLKLVLRGHLGGVLVSMLVTWVLTAAIVVVILMTPALLQKLHGFTPAQTLAANSLATLCLTLGCIGAGVLVDRFGSGAVLAVGSVALIGAVYALYLGVGSDPSLLVPLYALAGLCVAIVGAIPSVLVSSFPAPVRFSGISFSYNLAYAIFGGFTPPLVAGLVKANPLGPAHYVAALCVLGLLVGVFVARRRAAATAL